MIHRHLSRIKAPVAVAALLSSLMAGGAAAQTVLKIGYTPPKDSHYGVGAATFCDEIEKGTQGRYKSSSSRRRHSAASAR